MSEEIEKCGERGGILKNMVATARKRVRPAGTKQNIRHTKCNEKSGLLLPSDKLSVNETEIFFFSEVNLEIFKNIKPANQVRYFR